VGVGFVLFFWALLFGGAAVVCAVVLGLWSWWNQRRAFGRAGIFKAVAAAALPFLLLGCVGAAFAGYAIWCEAVRHVDPGIGDGWRVPVGNDLYFCMIDVPDDGYLLKGGCSGAPIVHGITELAAAGDLVVGLSESSRPFVRSMRGLLFGMEPWDPLSQTATIVALGLAAGAAAWIPTRRAMRVDPAIVLSPSWSW
jgi:hypothetical protein